jgi:hypothetical protein
MADSFALYGFMLQELAHDFIGVIKSCGSSMTTIHNGLQSVYACLTAEKSSETGKFVKVGQV